ncbi:MAG TPA: Ig-like domain-containing protein, partial [Ktedonobacterales bacterium]|nr:Ig-like domain-containing protein [Ktedonobacterales bacterium]
MKTRQHRPSRGPVLVILVGAVVAVMLACGFPTTSNQTHAQLTFCVVDSAQSSACDAPSFVHHQLATGDFSALHASQTVRVWLLDTDTGKPLPQLAIHWAIAGANARTASATTDGNGIATLTYTGANAGTDTITATGPSGIVYPRPRAAVIHWVAPQSHVHPIIFVHGINENANSIAHHQVWTALFEALDLVYDPNAIETFCYVDDHAYADPTQPAQCPAPDSVACASQCVSQSGVDANAVELARRVIALHARTGQLVTLLGYSMGTSITRTLLAGCLNTPTGQDSDAGADSPPDTDVQECDTAKGLVNDAFFLNGVQQGSWLMTVKGGLDAASLAGDGIPATALSPFYAVLPALEQEIFSTVKSKMGLDATSPAATDLTPGSANILAHNSVPLPSTVKAYTFYGAIQLRLDVNIFNYQLAGTTPLTLGDLVLLA